LFLKFSHGFNLSSEYKNRKTKAKGKAQKPGEIKSNIFITRGKGKNGKRQIEEWYEYELISCSENKKGTNNCTF